MRSILVILLVFSITFVVHAEPAAGSSLDSADTTQESTQTLESVEEYIQYFFRYTHPKRAQKALQYAPLVVQVAEEFGVDPLFIAVIVSYESTWNPKAKSSKNAKGLMQTKGIASKGYDTKIPIGQLRAGTDYLLASYTKCGTVKQALRRYQTGNCVSEKGQPGLRYRKWQQARERAGLPKLKSPFF